jgi:hypothetical protein
MGKSGGGAPDTSGLEKATKEATALQREIYEQTRGDVQPWYQAGVGGINKLADLLGVSGGSVQGRDDIYNELLPQYTQQQTTQGGGMWTGMDGALFGSEDEATGSYDYNPWEMTGTKAPRGGVTQQYAPQTTESIDYDALNAAVEERLGSQGTPEGYGSLLERFDMSKFEEDPGYQYRQDEAQKALERQMSAQGVTLGGGGYGEVNPAAMRAMQEQSQGLASQEYNNAYNRYENDQNSTYNRLAGIAGMGQQSTGIMSGAGQNYATNAGNLQTGLAQSQYQAAQANQANQGSMFGDILGTAATLGAAYLTGGGSLAATGAAGLGTKAAAQGAAASFFSDRRLKTDIELIGEENGHNLYSFKYRQGGDSTFIGVMADEVEKVDPEAIIEDPSGYKKVNYERIGVKMRLV